MRSLGVLLSLLAVVVLQALGEPNYGYPRSASQRSKLAQSKSSWGQRSGGRYTDRYNDRYNEQPGQWNDRYGRYTDARGLDWGNRMWGNKGSKNWNKPESKKKIDKDYKKSLKHFSKLDKKTPWRSRLRRMRNDDGSMSMGLLGGNGLNRGPAGGWNMRNIVNQRPVLGRPGLTTSGGILSGGGLVGPNRRPVVVVPPGLMNDPNFNLDDIPGYLQTGVFNPNDPLLRGQVPRPIVDPNPFFDDRNDFRNDLNEINNIIGGVNGFAGGAVNGGLPPLGPGGNLGGNFGGLPPQGLGNLPPPGFGGPVPTDLLGNVNSPGLLGNVAGGSGLLNGGLNLGGNGLNNGNLLG